MLRTELAEKEERLQKAAQAIFSHIQPFNLHESSTYLIFACWHVCRAQKLRDPDHFCDFAEPTEDACCPAEELPEAQQVFAQSEAAQRLAEAAAKEKARL